jgi:hypothetical protein
VKRARVGVGEEVVGEDNGRDHSMLDDDGRDLWRKALMAGLVDDPQHKIKGCNHGMDAGQKPNA